MAQASIVVAIEFVFRHHKQTPAQLGAEWVQLENTGTLSADLADVELYHLAYARSGAQPEWQRIMGFHGALAAGKSLRIHSGQVRDLSVLRPEDVAGADYHLFTGRDAYVWNNAEGDAAGLWRPSGKRRIDQASYEPFPPEGAVLVRLGDRLVVSHHGARMI